MVGRFIFLFVALVSMPAVAQESVTDESLLERFECLRVADVSDGMDFVGMRDRGLMDPEISAIWRDFEDMSHQFVGIAMTVRYVPEDAPAPEKLTPAEFDAWVKEQYQTVTPEPFAAEITPGTAIVLDTGGASEAGIAGSFNALAWMSNGMVGMVANGGIRDTDEIAKQKIPAYMPWEARGRGIRPGRNRFESFNEPVTVGGVVVHPGDVLVADGDGVIVVPRAVAVTVADYARKTLDQDKAGRRSLYERMGRPLDQTVSE